MLKDKTLMITGGTGSFGNAVLDRFLKTGVKEIRIFSRDEKKQEDMRIQYKNDKIKFYIGDVRDFESINSAMTGVDFVFSAAALKQVPSCEFFPVEAVKTNILGTDNTLRAAIENGVKKVIVLSTDKAVYPINAMGMSKGLMEKVAVAKSRTVPEGGTTICCTRYGNVMASRGSVIPLFVQQIQQGLPITVTDPEMTRFMMSLDDDLNISRALGYVFIMIRDVNTAMTENTLDRESKIAVSNFLAKVDSVVDIVEKKELAASNEEVERLIAERNRLRAERNFSEADKIRDKLLQMNIITQDTKDGTTWYAGN